MKYLKTYESNNLKNFSVVKNWNYYIITNSNGDPTSDILLICEKIPVERYKIKYVYFIESDKVVIVKEPYFLTKKEVEDNLLFTDNSLYNITNNLLPLLSKTNKYNL